MANLVKLQLTGRLTKVQLIVNRVRVQPTAQHMVNLAKVQHMAQPIAKVQLMDQLVNLAKVQLGQPAQRMAHIVKVHPMGQPVQLVSLAQPELKTSKWLKDRGRQFKPKSLQPLPDFQQAKAQLRNGSPGVNQVVHTLLKMVNTMAVTSFPVHT